MTAPDLASALRKLTEAEGAPQAPAPSGRRYRPREVFVLLAAFAAGALLLESEALVGWTQRLEANELQTHVHAGLAALAEVADAARLTLPRRGLLALTHEVSARLDWH